MKFFLLGIVLMAIFTACGEEKIKLYSIDEKVKVVEAMIISKDKNAEKEFKKITQELYKKMKEGDTEAKKEHHEWLLIERDIQLSSLRQDVSDKSSGAIKMLKGEE